MFSIRSKPYIILGQNSGLTLNFNYEIGGYMLKDDIVEGVYLKQVVEMTGKDGLDAAQRAKRDLKEEMKALFKWYIACVPLGV